MGGGLHKKGGRVESVRTGERAVWLLLDKPPMQDQEAAINRDGVVFGNPARHRVGAVTLFLDKPLARVGVVPRDIDRAYGPVRSEIGCRQLVRAAVGGCLH